MEKNSIDYSCAYCQEKISKITKSLQKHPSSRLWKKYGKCCASCVSEKNLVFEDNSTGKGENFKSLESFLVYRKKGPGLDPLIPLDLRGNDSHYLATWVSNGSGIILCGKIISGIGVISALSFFYTELNLLVFAGIPLILFGIVVCRIGVRKNQRTLKLIRDYSKIKRPGSNN